MRAAYTLSVLSVVLVASGESSLSLQSLAGLPLILIRLARVTVILYESHMRRRSSIKCSVVLLIVPLFDPCSFS